MNPYTHHIPLEDGFMISTIDKEVTLMNEAMMFSKTINLSLDSRSSSSQHVLLDMCGNNQMLCNEYKKLIGHLISGCSDGPKVYVLYRVKDLTRSNTQIGNRENDVSFIISFLSKIMGDFFSLIEEFKKQDNYARVTAYQMEYGEEISAAQIRKIGNSSLLLVGDNIPIFRGSKYKVVCYPLPDGLDEDSLLESDVYSSIAWNCIDYYMDNLRIEQVDWSEEYPALDHHATIDFYIEDRCVLEEDGRTYRVTLYNDYLSYTGIKWIRIRDTDFYQYLQKKWGLKYITKNNMFRGISMVNIRTKPLLLQTLFEKKNMTPWILTAEDIHEDQSSSEDESEDEK
jgi:hypothetical protein